MGDNQIVLEPKYVKDINGTFYVPSYQRGYRWGEDEVIRLLDDIYQNGRNAYCLQPIVVRRKSGSFELIDGQQRLTTLYLIYKYLHQLNPGYYDEPKFQLVYETRENSEEFLNLLDLSKRDENIDFWFLANAYERIERWFAEEKRVRDRTISECFDLYTKVIWYEVDESEDAISLFTRLNIGKIPLTSAELVKAMFLKNSGDNSLYRVKQEEISLQWDSIEQELHNDSLWAFLTNSTSIQYQTRIDLVLDLITKKNANNRETYYTFFEIDKLGKDMPLDDVWRKIQQTFLVLKDWFEDHELYHKIGYLITSETQTLLEIFNYSINRTKSEFYGIIDSLIRESIKFERKNYGELTYDEIQDRKRLSTILLLFNVESTRINGEKTQWFPFSRFKDTKNGKVSWSLEHIHAQQSEGLRDQKMWKEWLRLHIPSVKSVLDISESHNDGLIVAMQKAINKTTLERSEFDKLQQRVTELLSVKGNVESLHSISNLALLSSDDNAALSNSTFDVKRNRIIERDKCGQYIPFCTKMVFLKYYTKSENTQLHFWGSDDRKAYINEMNEVLKPYLLEPIKVSEEA